MGVNEAQAVLAIDCSMNQGHQSPGIVKLKPAAEEQVIIARLIAKADQ